MGIDQPDHTPPCERRLEVFLGVSHETRCAVVATAHPHAALYLDQGYDAAEAFILRIVLIHLDEVLASGSYADPKSRFQEEAQERHGVTPMYKVLREWGPDHDKHFVSGVYVSDELIAEGEGASKQEAQRAAAKNALETKGW